MSRLAFIGDELSAAGFRLAGVEVHVPAADAVAGLFQELRGRRELILITAQMARHIPSRTLEEALMQSKPLVLLLTDVRNRVSPPDIARTLRRQLGMAE